MDPPILSTQSEELTYAIAVSGAGSPADDKEAVSSLEPHPTVLSAEAPEISTMMRPLHPPGGVAHPPHPAQVQTIKYCQRAKACNSCHRRKLKCEGYPCDRCKTSNQKCTCKEVLKSAKCDRCYKVKQKCSGTLPCMWCTSTGRECTYNRYELLPGLANQGEELAGVIAIPSTCDKEAVPLWEPHPTAISATTPTTPKNNTPQTPTSRVWRTLHVTINKCRAFANKYRTQ